MGEEHSNDLARTKETISRFIQENFLMYQEGKTLDDDTSFLDEGIIDSTGILEVITFLEETYQIKIENEELVPENLDSIARISAFVEKKRKQSGAGAEPMVA